MDEGAGHEKPADDEEDGNAGDRRHRDDDRFWNPVKGEPSLGVTEHDLQRGDQPQEIEVVVAMVVDRRGRGHGAATGISARRTNARKRSRVAASVISGGCSSPWRKEGEDEVGVRRDPMRPQQRRPSRR